MYLYNTTYHEDIISIESYPHRIPVSMFSSSSKSCHSERSEEHPRISWRTYQVPARSIRKATDAYKYIAYNIRFKLAEAVSRTKRVQANSREKLFIVDFSTGLQCIHYIHCQPPLFVERVKCQGEDLLNLVNLQNFSTMAKPPWINVALLKSNRNLFLS